MKKQCFNTTEKDIEKRKYDIFIGISLGVLKPLTEKMAKEYLEWALKNTKNKVLILIADKIAKFNYRIFSGYSEGKSLRSALKEGVKYENFFKMVKKQFSEKEQKRILILRWEDIWNKRKERIRVKLEDKYQSSKKFREIIISFVKKYAEKRGKELSNEKLDYLSQYILAELPTLLDGIEYKNEKYNLLLYPTFTHSGMSDFVTNIEDGKIFPNLKKELSLDKKVAIVEFHLPTINNP